jgi:hypothetical protein
VSGVVFLALALTLALAPNREVDPTLTTSAVARSGCAPACGHDKARGSRSYG